MGVKKQLADAYIDANAKVKGHDIMDIARFFEDTKHMIIFDVIKDECPVGWSGERIRMFLTEEGYESAVLSEKRGEMIIRKHYLVKKGDMKYVSQEREHNR